MGGESTTKERSYLVAQPGLELEPDSIQLLVVGSPCGLVATDQTALRGSYHTNGNVFQLLFKYSHTHLDQ